MIDNGQVYNLCEEVEEFGTFESDNFKEKIEPYLFTSDAWEQKEHEQVYNNNLNKVKECISYMMDNESIFNDLLSTYNITVVTFVARNPIK